jgi:hypothetical protein
MDRIITKKYLASHPIDGIFHIVEKRPNADG